MVILLIEKKGGSAFKNLINHFQGEPSSLVPGRLGLLRHSPGGQTGPEIPPGTSQEMLS